MDTSVNEGGEQVSQGLNEDASQLTLTGAQKRAAWVLVGLMATVAYAGLWYFFFYDYWGERALRSLLEAIGIPLLIVLLWWPVVWASAKWPGPAPMEEDDALEAAEDCPTGAIVFLYESRLFVIK